MRRSLMLGLCIVLCSAMVAQAEWLPANMFLPTTLGTQSYTQCEIPQDSIEYQRTENVNGTSLDMIEFRLVALPSEVPEAPGVFPSNSGYIQQLEGTWAASGVTGAGIALVQMNGTVRDWKLFTGVTAEMQAAKSAGMYPSYVQFNEITVPTSSAPGFWNRELTGDTLSGTPMARHFSGTWKTSNPMSYGIAPEGVLIYHDPEYPEYDAYSTGLIATMYVTHGADVTFTGHVGNPDGATVLASGLVDNHDNQDGYCSGGFWFNNGVNGMGGFRTAPIPEPSMLALAGMGLVGLLCYAWRKRR